MSFGALERKPLFQPLPQDLWSKASQVAQWERVWPASAGDAEDMGSILWLGRAHGVGSGNPLQYSCLESSVDTGTWQATVLRVAKSQTSKEQLSMHARTHYAGGFVGTKEARVIFHVGPMLGAEKGASANEERRMRGSGSAGSQSKLMPKRNVGGRDFPSIGEVPWRTFSCFVLFLKDISTFCKWKV